MTIDGRVNNLNQDTFKALQYAHALRPNGPHDEKSATTIANAILKDNVIDAGERDLIDELTKSTAQKVVVSAQKGQDFDPKDIAVANRFTDNAKALLQNLKPQTGVSDLELLWRQGPAAFGPLTDIYSKSPADKTRVLNFLAGKLGKAWEFSTISNGYGPLRQLIGVAYSGVNALEGERNTKGRTMLYDAVSQIDKAPDGSNGPIPDFIYNWIRPGGLI